MFIIIAIAFFIIAEIAMAIGLAVGVFPLGATKADKKSRSADYRFFRKPLLNKPEKSLIVVLDAVVPDIFGPDARVLSQVSYGEFLKGEDKAAHASINQKRADFVVVDGDFQVFLVVEYQGTGHYGRGEKARENAQHRDRVKRAACASAGITMIEVPAKFTKDYVKEILGKST